jgi:hypothetical protein
VRVFRIERKLAFGNAFVSLDGLALFFLRPWISTSPLVQE